MMSSLEALPFKTHFILPNTCPGGSYSVESNNRSPVRSEYFAWFSTPALPGERK
jgi:hypothetical protein